MESPPTTQSERDLQDLERRLRELDARLAYAWDPRTDAQREKLGRAFDTLWEARQIAEQVLTLPTCVCGKRSHPEPESARRHLHALVVMRPHNRVTRGLFPSTQMKRPLSVYRCWYATSEVYHVGHLVVQR